MFFYLLIEASYVTVLYNICPVTTTTNKLSIGYIQSKAMLSIKSFNYSRLCPFFTHASALV